MAKKNEATFTGSIPENYDKYLAPILLEPYGQELVRRLPINGLKDVLELACGTGIVTRHLRERLGDETRLVATDFSDDMLKVARAKPPLSKPVEWKVADATDLPFKDGSFDAVVCQFGVMFFPDREKAMREMFRVLRPGGRVLFNVWDDIKHNDFPRTAHEVIEKMFDSEPPAFYKTPFGFHDHFEIRTMLRGAGFVDVALTTVEMRVTCEPANAAIGFVEGNPIADEIKNRLGKDVSEAKEKVEQALGEEFGKAIAKGHAQAIVVGARKPGTFATNVRPVAVRTEKAPKANVAKPQAAKPIKAKAKVKSKPA
jgi:ubiquinone/menaquinone biosynthesis C-methylase UbiE